MVGWHFTLLLLQGDTSNQDAPWLITGSFCVWRTSTFIEVWENSSRNTHPPPLRCNISSLEKQEEQQGTFDGVYSILLPSFPLIIFSLINRRATADAYKIVLGRFSVSLKQIAQDKCDQWSLAQLQKVDGFSSQALNRSSLVELMGGGVGRNIITVYVLLNLQGLVDLSHLMRCCF